GHKSRWCVGRSGDHGNPASNQFGYQFRQPVELILGPAIFDRDVPALSKPRFAQTLSERPDQVRRIVRGRTLEKRHYWHWCCCCARAASGHVTAEPPTTLMKSRRRIAAQGSGVRRYRLITSGICDWRN